MNCGLLTGARGCPVAVSVFNGNRRSADAGAGGGSATGSGSSSEGVDWLTVLKMRLMGGRGEEPGGHGGGAR